MLEEVPGNAKSAPLDDNLGEPSPVSSQQVGLSSGSYLSSEMSDIELAEKEVAKSMMSILLPQAIPLLTKSKKKKKSKHKKKENYTLSAKIASAYNPSNIRCRGNYFSFLVEIYLCLMTYYCINISFMENLIYQNS